MPLIPGPISLPWQKAGLGTAAHVQLTAAPCPVVISSSHCFQGAARSQAVSPRRCLLLDKTPLGPWPGPSKLRSPTSLWTLSFLSFPHRRSKRRRPPSARQALGFWTLQGFLETAPSGSPSPNTINQGQGARQDHPFRLKGPQAKMLILCLSGAQLQGLPQESRTHSSTCASPSGPGEGPHPSYLALGGLQYLL